MYHEIRRSLQSIKRVINMFLAQLNDVEKIAMLDIAFGISMSDSVFAPEEREMIESFKFEMRLSQDPKKRDLSDIIKDIQGSSTQNKKIILLESAGVVCADGVIDDAEMDYLRALALGLQISEPDMNQCLILTQDILGVVRKINEFIKG
jgi:tellurite resistance protein